MKCFSFRVLIFPFQFSVYMTCISFIKICSSVFYSVEPFVSEIASLISFLDSLLLAYRNIIDFGIFTFCPARNLLYSFKFLIYFKKNSF